MSGDGPLPIGIVRTALGDALAPAPYVGVGDAATEQRRLHLAADRLHRAARAADAEGLPHLAYPLRSASQLTRSAANGYLSADGTRTAAILAAALLGDHDAEPMP